MSWSHGRAQKRRRQISTELKEQSGRRKERERLGEAGEEAWWKTPTEEEEVGALHARVRQPACLACWHQPLDDDQEMRHSWMSSGSESENRITRHYTT
ncbi:unnamed protein product [Pleuronectes platessa]|uniref:Uncharacterized protein n=1 Tax=Pleuronectes platessa TaxID=8262 RepID=A0A9N7ZF54_PLEPL|nr:unnamed protein product [Pleuronectes platessa]